MLAVLALLVTETCQFSDVSRAELGTFDFLELDSAAYQVEIASAPVSELQLQESLQAQGEVSYVKTFYCVLKLVPYCHYINGLIIFKIVAILLLYKYAYIHQRRF